MDHLKEGIGLRGYGQQTRSLPTNARATRCSSNDRRIKEENVRMLYHIQLQREEQLQEMRREQEEQPMFFGPGRSGKSGPAKKENEGCRNDPCPCGSGKNTRNAMVNREPFIVPGFRPGRRHRECATAKGRPRADCRGRRRGCAASGFFTQNDSARPRSRCAGNAWRAERAGDPR